MCGIMSCLRNCVDLTHLEPIKMAFIAGHIMETSNFLAKPRIQSVHQPFERMVSRVPRVIAFGNILHHDWVSVLSGGLL